MCGVRPTTALDNPERWAKAGWPWSSRFSLIWCDNVADVTNDRGLHMNIELERARAPKQLRELHIRLNLPEKR